MGPMRLLLALVPADAAVEAPVTAPVPPHIARVLHALDQHDGARVEQWLWQVAYADEALAEHAERLLDDVCRGVSGAHEAFFHAGTAVVGPVRQRLEQTRCHGQRIRLALLALQAVGKYHELPRRLGDKVDRRRPAAVRRAETADAVRLAVAVARDALSAPGVDERREAVRLASYLRRKAPGLLPLLADRLARETDGGVWAMVVELVPKYDPQCRYLGGALAAAAVRHGDDVETADRAAGKLRRGGAAAKPHLAALRRHAGAKVRYTGWHNTRLVHFDAAVVAEAVVAAVADGDADVRRAARGSLRGAAEGVKDRFVRPVRALLGAKPERDWGCRVRDEYLE